jgi:hypothetical protein
MCLIDDDQRSVSKAFEGNLIDCHEMRNWVEYKSSVSFNLKLDRRKLWHMVECAKIFKNRNKETSPDSVCCVCCKKLKNI